MKINEIGFGCQCSLSIPEEPLLLSPSLSPYWEVKLHKEEEIANWEEGANTRMIMIGVSNTRIRTLLQLGTGFSTKDTMAFISWEDVKCF